MDTEPLAITPETRLAALGIDLPAAAPSPIGSFRNVRRAGNMIYVSGQGPVRADGTLIRGKVGSEISAEEAREHARLVALNILTALRDSLGSLDRVAGVVKLLGMVNAEPDFERHPYVIDGASNLLAQVFGEAGAHARSAFGVGSLPNRISVEIEAIFEMAGPAADQSR
ncbi:RidA family protein [Paracoccus siganidrum]|uniref:RidA family protein n=1 Tax=Paracoccus siganidrum TaxID=1276757 RepID=A0A419A5E1_9RHOB|nr:RidA family protein [Paracoccus siganidrum]RJL10544.1 RidA family protein [Paracoccus siganidrum]RMC35184.1 RidA family protein [Paracoccus siganidrum]